MLTITNYNQQTPNFQARMKMDQTSLKIGKYLEGKGINIGKAILASAGLAGTAGTVMLASPNAVSTPDAAKWVIGTGMASTIGLMGSNYVHNHKSKKTGDENVTTDNKHEAEAVKTKQNLLNAYDDLIDYAKKYGTKESFELLG